MIPGLRYAAWWALEKLHHGPLTDFIAAETESPAYSAPNIGELAENRTLPLWPTDVEDVKNPVITAADIRDYGAVEYVADPFLYYDGHWHMFFEVYNGNREPDAVIGHAASLNGYEWKATGTVLNTGFHLSYPYIFEFNGCQYMVPEQEHPEGPRVSVYKAESFPTSWRFVADLITPNHEARDPVVFEFENQWWLLVADTSSYEMYLYHADKPMSKKWIPHKANPVISSGPSAARPGGNPIVTDSSVFLFYQDCRRRYGHTVRAFEVTELTPDRFVQRELAQSPVLTPSDKRLGWNSGCMHTYAPRKHGNQWICAVDGNTDFGSSISNGHWAIGIYKSGGPGKEYHE